MPETLATARVLVVSREIALLRPLWLIGKSNSWNLETASSGWEAMERIQSGVTPHLLILDMPRGDSDSLHILRWLRRISPDLPVIAVFHPEDASKQKEATHLGAEEVLIRPLDEARLEDIVRKHLHSAATAKNFTIVSDEIEHVGEDECYISHVMQKLRAQAELLGQVDVPVLILGEPGSGKSAVARLIHKLSVHSGFDFHRVNCATMPANLLEVELFGRTNGSYLSHAGGRGNFGKLERSERGTLLIEEIAEMPLALQYRFLQAIQQHKFSRAEEHAAPGGMRILVTSSANVDRALSENRLREDLYYRLSAFTVHVPPVRQRKEEIKNLLQYSMHKIARYYGLPPREFTQTALDACVSHSWPGNLPELETFVKRYLVAGEQEPMLIRPETHPVASVGPVDLPPMFVPAKDRVVPDLTTNSLKSLIQNVKSDAERNAISAALEKTGWNRKAAARLLKVSYRTLLYKIERYRMTATPVYLSPLTEARLINLASDKRSGKAS